MKVFVGQSDSDCTSWVFSKIFNGLSADTVVAGIVTRMLPNTPFLLSLTYFWFRTSSSRPSTALFCSNCSWKHVKLLHLAFHTFDCVMDSCTTKSDVQNFVLQHSEKRISFTENAIIHQKEKACCCFWQYRRQQTDQIDTCLLSAPVWNLSSILWVQLLVSVLSPYHPISRCTLWTY